MSLESLLAHEHGHVTGLLTGRYVRTLIWCLAAVLLLWMIGFEAIYAHPAPFYAAPQPAFNTILVPGAFAALLWAAYLVVSRQFTLRGRTRMLLGWAGVSILFVTLFAVFYQQATAQNQPIRPFAADFCAVFRWHALAMALFTLALTALLRVLRDDHWFDAEPDLLQVRWLLFGLVVFSVAFACAIAMLRGGPAGIAQAYMRSSYEYIGDIGSGRSIHGLFGDYLRLRPHLSMHARVHPPGPIALLWLLSHIAGRGPMALSLATVTFGALGVIPLYFWGRELTSRRVALTCCFLYSVMPSIVLFTATSADILFTPFTLTTLYLFTRAIQRRSTLCAAAAGIGYAVLSLLSFSLIGIGAYFGLVGLWSLSRRGIRRNVFQTALLMAATFLFTHAAVRWWSGFDIVACFQACKAQFDLDQQHLDLVTPRWPAWTWRFLNPACWLFFAGVPASLLFFWRLRRPDPAFRGLFLVFLLTFLALDLLYLARGEGERSALYVFPFIALPAAQLLDQIGVRTRSTAALAATLAFMAFQCWLIESYLYTYW